MVIESSQGNDGVDFEILSSLRFDILLLSGRDYEPLSATDPEYYKCLYMVDFHRDRMLDAAEHFDWPDAAKLLQGPQGSAHLRVMIADSIKRSRHNGEVKPLKIRMLLSHKGLLRFEILETSVVTIRDLLPSKLPLYPEVKPFTASPLTGGTMTLGQSDHLAAPTGQNSSFVPWDIHIDSVSTTASAYTSFKTTSRAMYDVARHRAGIQSYSDRAEVLLYNEGEEIMEGSIFTVYFFRNNHWVTPPSMAGGQRGTTRRWALENCLCHEESIKKQSLIQGETVCMSNGVRGFVQGKLRL